VSKIVRIFSLVYTHTKKKKKRKKKKRNHNEELLDEANHSLTMQEQHEINIFVVKLRRLRIKHKKTCVKVSLYT